MKLVQKSKALAAVLGLVLGMSVIAGCGSSGAGTEGKSQPAEAKVEGTVTASGSTALLPLLKPAQEEFQKKHDKVTINIAEIGRASCRERV
jgi:phosphate transport system substrate-binding protein